MKLLYRCCAGLDIHRDTVSACLRRRVRGQAAGAVEEQVIRHVYERSGALAQLVEKKQGRQIAMNRRACIGFRCGTYWSVAGSL
jgi:hypothetical protein